MKIRGLSIGLSLAVFVVCTSSLSATEKQGHFFGSIDYYLSSDIADDIETADRDLAAEATAGGDPATAHTEVDNGLGGRIGYLRNLNPHFALGGSVGYIVGPKIDSKFTLLPGGISGLQGYANGTFETSYLRIMFEGIGKIPLTEKVTLNLGVGLGGAQAKTTQEFSVYLTDGFDELSGESDADESTLGFSWEISPSIDIHLEKAALSFGLRYSKFPKIKETDETSEMDWTALGFFAGMKF